MAQKAGQNREHSLEDDEDDWEKEYDARSNDAEETESSKNARLWQDANSDCPTPRTPTYTILTSASSSSSSSSRVPPQAAIIPPAPGLMILKRPSSASSSTSSTSRSSSTREKTLAEREKEYEEAKKRIFGDAPINSSRSKPLDIGKLSLKDAPTGGGSGGTPPRRSRRASGSSSSQTSNSNSNSGRTTPNSTLSVAPGFGSAGSVVRNPKGPGEGRGFGGPANTARPTSSDGKSKGRGRGRGFGSQEPPS